MALTIEPAHSTQLFVSYDDPLNDFANFNIDLTGMVLSFDNETGAYELTVNFDAANPFNGTFNVNANLLNGNIDPLTTDLAFVNINKIPTVAISTTELVFTGIDTNLLAWSEGDSIANSSSIFDLPTDASFTAFGSGIQNGGQSIDQLNPTFAVVQSLAQGLSTFSFNTKNAHFPVVKVSELGTFEVTMDWLEDKSNTFILKDARPTTKDTSTPATFSFETGLLTIPMISVPDGKGSVGIFDVKMSYVPNSDPLSFTVTDITAPMSKDIKCSTNPCIFIPRIWSSQFSNYTGNSYPGGAGPISYEQKYILTGTREGDEAHLMAEVMIPSVNSDPCLVDNLLFRPEVISSGFIIEDVQVTCTNSVVYMVFPTTFDIVRDFAVLSGLDINLNGRLDIGEESTRSEGRLRVVSQDIYENTRRFMHKVIGVGGFLGGYPIASEFARAFIYNEPITLDKTEVYTSAPILFETIESKLQSSLSHNVGIDYSNSSSGTIKNYFFGGNSHLANEIRSSWAFEKVLLNTLTDKASELATGYPDETSFSFSLPTRIEFGDLDQDLGFTFHVATLVDTTIEGDISCVDDSLRLTMLNVAGGDLIDLYDWNYEEHPLLDQKMAIIQAGFGTLGQGGGIFRTQVNLKGAIDFSETPLDISLATSCNDLAGSWNVSVQVDARSCGEGIYTDNDIATVTVNGKEIAVTINEITRSGILNNDSISYSVSYPEDGGVTTSTGLITFSGNQISGNSNWSWSSGSFSCSGTSIISGTKI